ncbi:sensor domain-containing diguanylate cyclase [Geodermatophilus sp. TF02-6]|uniref:GGDEF domain-containing protein n=1 Tax=Geodermatophilus sp. TF02-6 TaxID=2250575 RepID=UPI000DE97722|nr:GGDEF domain-containing protein [Geodermatophilus sp. TF02-6]RBY76416.1 sensor domain-containing diguanylate cyclase [Geodermatophilus sp. TF02-6]
MDAHLSEAFVAATGVLLCVVAADGRILLANPALQQFTGRSADELLGRLFWEVWVVPEHRELARDAVHRAMATGRAWPQEGDWLTVDGGRRTISMHNDVLRDACGRPYAIACVGLDVTDRRRREARLHEQAATDRLTGIPHRGALFDALRQHLDPAEGAGCTMLFCDLDDFKTVNDVHGHAVGDRLLAAVAARLRDLLGPEEVVARFGGDEFVVLCPGHATDRVDALCGQVADAVSAPFDGPCGPLSVGVSVGVAFGHPGEAADDLIARADRAMYGAKTHHRRRRARAE